MLVAQARWLPQYKAAVPAAKARFASEEKLGTHSTEGAARLKTKTVEEMKQNAAAARSNAGAADKAMAQRKQAAAKAIAKKTK
jgi:alpha-galactosidase